MLTSRLLLGLPLGLLLFGECTPTSTELLANLAEGQVGHLLLDFGALGLGEEHVAGELLLAATLLRERKNAIKFCLRRGRVVNEIHAGERRFAVAPN